MKLRILYFAVVRERLGRGEEIFEFSGATVDELLAQLIAKNPALAGLRAALKIAVNQEFVGGDEKLRDGDEVALLPPVSGGAGNFFRLSDAPLSLDEVVRAVGGDEHGGVVTFTGAVRGLSRGKRIVRLEYEAYRPMAEAKLAEVGRAVAAKWPGVRVAIAHRLGVLAVGEAAVVVAVSAPHRAEAFEACRAAIDLLKESVPIWKKEVADDGESWVGLGP